MTSSYHARMDRARLDMPIGEAIFSQRSIRRFRPDPLPLDDLHLIVEAAVRAPNGGNRQPARFLILTDRALIEQFGSLYREAWWAKRADEGRPWTTRDEIPESERTSRSAALLADEAAVENVKVQLSYTEIRAPIGGRTGNLLLHQGNVVKANDVGNPMVVINRIHPIYVAFSVPEAQLAEIKRYQAAGPLPVEAQVNGVPGGVVRGRLTFVNNTVDPTTGTIQLKATFENDENALWPGQFVNVALTLTRQTGALLVPSKAVQSGQKGQYVFVVKPDQTVEPRTVVAGALDGRDVVITSGLRPGERVVTDGQLRLAPGTRVDVKTAPPGTPEPAAAPKAGG